MKLATQPTLRMVLLIVGVLLPIPSLWAEPLPLKQVVELALRHSTTAGIAAADEQRALASYHEVRNQYLPLLVVGSGLGASYGFPLSLEGSAPSLVNVNAQSSVFNLALRDFVRATRTEWQASTLQGKNQRNQVIQDTVLSYAELSKWELLMRHLRDEQDEAKRMEGVVAQRIQEGVDQPLASDKAKLTSARVRLRITEAQGAIDVLRSKLSHLTGLPAASIETLPESMPALPEVKEDDDVAAQAVASDPGVKAAEIQAAAKNYRARGEHRAMWPTLDFAAQYALLSTFNNYFEFYKTFNRNNASVGVVIRFPFLNPSQRAHAQAADAEAARAKHEAQAAKNQVSEETLKLQRSVQQLSAAQEVAGLEYRVAQSNVEALQIRLDAGGATLHDLQDARDQANARYGALQDANFELQKAQITLLRATGGLDSWVGVAEQKN